MLRSYLLKLTRSKSFYAAIAFQNFRKWRTDRKIWLITAVQLVTVLYALHDLHFYVDLDSTPMTAW